jgi:hypothetical protein
MKKKRFIEDMQEALKESVDFFSPKRKKERDIGVGISFLENLGIKFERREVFAPSQDPPDVVFRGAMFEIKEILDPGRLRHKEYKDKLEKAQQVTDPDDLLELYTPLDLTPEDISRLALNQIKTLSRKYDSKTIRNLDLLIYINLIHHHLKKERMTKRSIFSDCGWRSISALQGWGGLVFYADKSAPEFLREKEGTLTLKNFSE